MARAPPRGGFRRKPLAKLRADEQEPHTRRRLEAGWHKTAKPRDLTATVNEAVRGSFGVGTAPRGCPSCEGRHRFRTRVGMGSGLSGGLIRHAAYIPR